MKHKRINKFKRRVSYLEVRLYELLESTAYSPTLRYSMELNVVSISRL